MEDNPKNPNVEVAIIPEDLRGSLSHVFSIATEVYVDREVYDGDLYALSADFEWDAGDPNPDGYALVSVVFEPGWVSEDEVWDVLQEYVRALREDGYEMAGLPGELPVSG